MPGFFCSCGGSTSRLCFSRNGICPVSVNDRPLYDLSLNMRTREVFAAANNTCIQSHQPLGLPGGGQRAGATDCCFRALAACACQCVGGMDASLAGGPLAFIGKAKLTAHAAGTSFQRQFGDVLTATAKERDRLGQALAVTAKQLSSKQRDLLVEKGFTWKDWNALDKTARDQHSMRGCTACAPTRTALGINLRCAPAAPGRPRAHASATHRGHILHNFKR